MPTKKATAVKKAWSEANKLHKAMSQSDSHYSDDQGTQSTPGLARRYNSLMKKGRVPKQIGLKNKVLGYAEWLDQHGPDPAQPTQVSSEETKTSPTTGTAIDTNMLENSISLEQLQVLDTTCVQDAAPEN